MSIAHMIISHEIFTEIFYRSDIISCIIKSCTEYYTQISYVTITVREYFCLRICY